MFFYYLRSMNAQNYTIKVGVGKYNYLDKAYVSLINNLIFQNESWLERWDTYDEAINEIISIGGYELFEEIKYRLTGGEDINHVLLSIMHDELEPNLFVVSLIDRIKEYSDIDWLKNFH